ncbi:MAG: glycosyltransferase family 4 protein [Microthrixaceae bacterium]|nr:glycosyltransferase family 4 protein [Microthrixaceae bacterium]
MAAEADLAHIHMLAWRDLDDVEAGGSEMHAHNVASIWAQAGLKITMRTSFAAGRPPRTVRGGYTVIRKAGRYLVFPRSVVSEVAGRLGPCDGLVEIWNGMPFLSPIWWRGPRMVWLHHVHGPMWQMSLPPKLAAMGSLLEERIAPVFYRGSPVVTLSESSKAEMVDELGFKADRVRVIEPGIDPRFSPGGDRSPTPLVVAVGRLVPVKDFHRLIRVMHRVIPHVPEAKLVIVGDGYERDDLEALIADLDAASWVRLAGRVSDDELISLYRQAWTVASTSVREGWGMTITEAAACATPAVATRIAGHSDAIHDDRSGLLADTDDQLVAKLSAVLVDDALRSRLQRGALERAGALTWESTALGTFEVLAADAHRRRRRR